MRGLLKLITILLMGAIITILTGFRFVADAQSNDNSSLHVGGTLRHNMLWKWYWCSKLPVHMDTWRINILYDNPDGIGLNFEYWFYPTFGTHFIKQGWLEYNLIKKVSSGEYTWLVQFLLTF